MKEPNGFYLGPGFGPPTPEEEKEFQAFIERTKRSTQQKEPDEHAQEERQNS